MAIMTEAVLLELIALKENGALSEFNYPTLDRLLHRGYVIIVPPRRGGDHVSRVMLTEAGLFHLKRLKGNPT